MNEDILMQLLGQKRAMFGPASAPMADMLAAPVASGQFRSPSPWDHRNDSSVVDFFQSGTAIQKLNAAAEAARRQKAGTWGQPGSTPLPPNIG